VCPVYRRIGGHAYDAVYSGPMGAVLTPLLSAAVRGGTCPTLLAVRGVQRGPAGGDPLADMLVAPPGRLRRPGPPSPPPPLARHRTPRRTDPPIPAAPAAATPAAATPAAAAPAARPGEDAAATGEPVGHRRRTTGRPRTRRPASAPAPSDLPAPGPALAYPAGYRSEAPPPPAASPASPARPGRRTPLVKGWGEGRDIRAPPPPARFRHTWPPGEGRVVAGCALADSRLLEAALPTPVLPQGRCYGEDRDPLRRAGHRRPSFCPSKRNRLHPRQQAGVKGGRQARRSEPLTPAHATDPRPTNGERQRPSGGVLQAGSGQGGHR